MEAMIQTDVPARMRDGLMSNVYRPADGGPYPVLLARMPYGKDLPFDSTYLDPEGRPARLHRRDPGRPRPLRLGG